MRAKKIFELQHFIRGGDPYTKLGIGKIQQIQSELPKIREDRIPYTYKPLNQYTPNELLIIGVSEDHFELIKLALNKGADQLWWQSGGNVGGYHGLIMGICPSFAKIINVKMIKKSGKIKYFFTEKTPWSDYPVTSTIFKKKYSPINKDFVKKAQDLADKVNHNMNIIKSVKDHPEENIYPKFNFFTNAG